MARIYMRFPKGKALAVTLSYDDGVKQDRRLIEIMKKHELKGTFNLNSGFYASEGEESLRLSRSSAIELYKNSGMEVAVHSVTHPYLAMLPANLCTQEVLRDRANLEEDYDVIVRGMAYPNNSCNDDVVASLKQCGIAYARTTWSTAGFGIPEEWLRLRPTCHHNDPKLMKLAHSFVEDGKYGAPALFYLWGHSYEFDNDDNWSVIEEFAEYIGNRKEIWYATNIEIYDYVTAYQQLIFSMNEKKVYNPTNMVVYFQIDEKLYCVEPGENILENRKIYSDL